MAVSIEPELPRMLAYLFRRLIHGLVVLFVVVTVTFVMIQLAPGGPAVLLDPELDPATAELLRHRLGLDQPIYIQYINWLSSAARLDFGDSFSLSAPVVDLVLDRLPATLVLTGAAMLWSICVAIPLGIIAAKRRGKVSDHAATVVGVAGISVPSFWLGIMLILAFSVTLGVLPSAGMVSPGDFDPIDFGSHLLMPMLVLGFSSMAMLSRYTRSSLLGVLRQDYIRTAYAKGLPDSDVMLGHALRNALVPVLTVVGILVPRLVGGSIVVETVFSWPGVASLSVSAAFQRDYPIIMGVTVLIALVVVISNLVVDVLYAYVDPRIRLG